MALATRVVPLSLFADSSSSVRIHDFVAIDRPHLLPILVADPNASQRDAKLVQQQPVHARRDSAIG